MDQLKALNDLQQIRSILEKSKRSLTISSASAIFAGVYAVVGGLVCYYISLNSDTIIYQDIRKGQLSEGLITIGLVLMAILVLSISTGLFFSYRMAQKANQPLLTPASKKLALHFCIPLVTGGLFCLVCIWRGYLDLIGSSTLIFYGLAVWSAGNFTFSDIRILGVFQIALGLLALAFIGYGHIFWLIGFGVLHILYGVYHYFKYERS